MKGSSLGFSPGLSSLCLILLLLMVHYSSSQSLNSAICNWRTTIRTDSSRPSDKVIIGEFVSTTIGKMTVLGFMEDPNAFKTHTFVIPKSYQHVLAFVFAIHEINKDAELLPNTTLATKIYDNAFYAGQACQNTLRLLFLREGNPVNYNCVKKDKLMAVIGGLTSPNSIQIANVLNTYRIPQLSYGSFNPVLRDKTQFPSFYRMVPHEDPQYVGIVQLLKHFGWNWIVLMVSDDDSGETFLRTLRPRLLQNNICIAWMKAIPIVTSHLPQEKRNNILEPILLSLVYSNINVILVYGDYQSLECLRIILFLNEFVHRYPSERVWITTAEWDYTTVVPWDKFTPKSFNGTLSFSLHTNVVPEFQDFLKSVHPHRSAIYLIQQFWFTAFACSLPQYHMYVQSKENCTGEEKLGSLPGSTFEMGMSGQGYNIYNAVFAVAHALHAMDLAGAKHKTRGGGERWNLHKVQPWQVDTAIDKSQDIIRWKKNEWVWVWGSKS